MMRGRNLVIVLFAIYATGVFGQAPCTTNGNGFDPCSAEPLSMSTTCAAVAEEFRTNTCLGTNPTISSCGLTAGANIVWGTFYVPVDDNVTITWTASNNRNIRFGIYQFLDECLMTGETEIACVNNGGSGVDESTTIFLTAGQYWICGKSSGDLSNASEICVHSPNVPPPIIASDCGVGVNICTNLNFLIDPNGEGANTNEIPPSGSIGNPYYDGVTPNPWGTLNYGCLQIDESNSTWMVVNISTPGDLEFTFGGNGSQAGYYDWIMYPANATCADVLAHNTAPVRCNWNLVDYGGTGLANTIPAGGDAGNFEPALAVSAGDVFIICFSNYSSVQTSVPLAFGGTAGVSCTTLPVELVGFKGKVLLDNSVDLTWTTVSEKNNDYFLVQRGRDLTNFETIGNLDGTGNSNDIVQYSFNDDSPEVGRLNYYRLKQVDFDGGFEYSDVVTVKPNYSEISIYPNPSRLNEQVFIKLPSELERCEILVYDCFGRKVQARKNMSNDLIVIDELEEGTYLIEFRTDTEREFRRFVRSR